MVCEDVRPGGASSEPYAGNASLPVPQRRLFGLDSGERWEEFVGDWVPYLVSVAPHG